jgi:hypothetical protein
LLLKTRRVFAALTLYPPYFLYNIPKGGNITNNHNIYQMATKCTKLHPNPYQIATKHIPNCYQIHQLQQSIPNDRKICI